MVGGNVLWETSVIAAVNAGTCFASVAIWAAFGSAIGRLLGKPNCRRFGMLSALDHPVTAVKGYAPGYSALQE
jgi:hypothetical protein